MSETKVEAPKLREATELGQLVAATSPGSLYVVVLRSNALNMAVRWKDSVSLRIEPVDLPTLRNGDQTALAGIGFGVHSDKSYASVHFPLSGTQAVMAIAAMIGGVSNIVGGKASTITFGYLTTELFGKGA